jgi:hypothetical protein
MNKDKSNETISRSESTNLIILAICGAVIMTVSNSNSDSDINFIIQSIFFLFGSFLVVRSLIISFIKFIKDKTNCHE